MPRKRPNEEEGEVSDEPSAKRNKVSTSENEDKDAIGKEASDAPEKKDVDEKAEPSEAHKKIEETKPNVPLVEENAEDISDFGESDEEILNKESNVEEGENEENVLDEGEVKDDDNQLDEGEVKDDEDPLEDGERTSEDGPKADDAAEAKSRSGSRRSTSEGHGLLEGISDEELEESDKEDAESKTKARIANALGVDWSELLSAPKTEETSEEEKSSSLKDDWSMLAIVKRTGISEALCGGKEHYEKILEELNEGVEEEKQFKPVSKFASMDVYLRRRAERRKLLYSDLGPFGQGLTAKKDLRARYE